MSRKILYKILNKIIDIFFVIFIILPLYSIALPFVVIIKTIVTIWQPYFYKVSLRDYEEEDDKWNEHYQECLQKGIHVDFPPRRPEYGTFLGIAPWGKKSFKSLFDDDDDNELIE